MTRPPQQGIQRGSVLGASALVLESDDSARGFVCHALKYMGLVVHGVAGVDEAKRAFDALAEGGEVTLPIAPTFFSPMFGMCIDRFGTPWMISAEAPITD